MKVIIWPESLPVSKVRRFFNDAGYRENKDYRIGNTPKGTLFMRPLNQIILAQDALAMGFKSKELDTLE